MRSHVPKALEGYQQRRRQSILSTYLPLTLFSHLKVRTTPGPMATITTQFRNFKEPTKDQLMRNYFSLPPLPALDASGSEKDGSLPVDRVEVNAVCRHFSTSVSQGLNVNVGSQPCGWPRRLLCEP